MSSNKNSPQILLVEGIDDQHVSWALFEKHAIPETFEVIDSKGIDNLLIQLPVRFKQSDIKTIGIIIDADANLAARWQQLRDILAIEGVALPAVPAANGTIVKGNKKLGVWIMPNNQINGMLEDFIAFLIPPGDPLLPIANAALTNIEEQHLNKYISAHRSKALIHTWLAWQESPGTPMGSAITKRYLNSDVEIAQSFLNWIIALFG
jgi:hypothetical protein